MSLDSVSNRGERVILLIAVSGFLILIGLLVRTIWRVFTGYYLRATPLRRRKTKKRRKTSAT